MPSFLLALPLVLALLLGGCDPFALPAPSPLEEGRQLEVIEYAVEQPASRQAYADLGTFIIPGRVVIFDPGTGPDDPPHLVRSIRIPDRLTYDAQMDRDGFVWVATPDQDHAPIREAYVIDPHTATVHRALTLPEEVRAVAAVIVGSEYVYLRAWRDGFSGGIGVVDRGCAFDASQCEVRSFTELGDVTTTPEKAFHLTDDALYSFSGIEWERRGEQPGILQLNPQTGEVIRSSPYVGNFAFDEHSLYLIGYQVAGVNSIMRLDKETLDVEEEVEIGPHRGWIALEGDRLYVASASPGPTGSIEVYSAETLAPLDTVDVSAASVPPTAVFGFVAPGVLLLNHTAWLNTDTGAVVAGAFSLEALFSLALRLPEGHPLAY